MGFLGAGTRRCLAPALLIAATLLLAAMMVLPSMQRQRAPLPVSHAVAPAWHNYTSVDRASRPFEDAVFPRRLTHLDELRVEAPFVGFWLASAFVDSRPLLVKAAPELTILGVGPGALADEMGWDKSPLLCYVLLKQSGSQGTLTPISVPAYISALPDSHTDAKLHTGLLVTCPLVGSGGDILPWETSEIFVSLSTATTPPPPNAFVRAKALPHFDPVQHRLGAGSGAVCLQPLVGDTYAPSMRDFVAYYRALGFTDFYAYLLDPGPETIALLREMAHEDGFHPVRWTLPVEWLFSHKGYRVEPQDWEILGVPTLSPEEEYHYAYSGSTPPKQDVTVWAFAQNVAHHDCSFRAKIAGNRWVANIDWDEYLLLRPPSGVWPPPSRGHPASLLGDWAATYDHEAKTEKIPSAFLFQSAFVCILCQPSHPPTSPDPKLAALDLRRPTAAIPSIFVSPVRHQEWFHVGFRAKTILDPWAWFCSTIHQPVMSYAQYANLRAEAWKAGGTGDENWAVYSAVVRPSISLVFPPQVTNTTPTVGESEYSTGGMYHLRADRRIADAVASWEAAADESQQDLFTSTDGGMLLSRVRSPEDLWRQHVPIESAEGNLVEDWTLLDTMSSTLVEIIDDRRVKPLRRWTGSRWVGSASVDGLAPNLLLRAAFVLVVGLLVLYLATRRVWT